MTDRNGKPLKVGDKVTYEGRPGQVGTVTATRRTVAVVRFRGTNGKPCHYTNLTLVAPKPEPDYKRMYEESRELVRTLTRAAVAVLTAPDGIDKASAYARLSEAVKEAL